MGRREDALTEQAKRSLRNLQHKRAQVKRWQTIRAKNIDLQIAHVMMRVLCEHPPAAGSEYHSMEQYGYWCPACKATTSSKRR